MQTISFSVLLYYLFTYKSWQIIFLIWMKIYTINIHSFNSILNRWLFTRRRSVLADQFHVSRWYSCLMVRGCEILSEDSDPLCGCPSQVLKCLCQCLSQHFFTPTKKSTDFFGFGTKYVLKKHISNHFLFSKFRRHISFKSYRQKLSEYQQCHWGTSVPTHLAELPENTYIYIYI